MSDFFDRVSKLPPKRLAVLAAQLNEELEQVKSAASEPIAIVGLGCRYPGGACDADSLWRLLLDGRDAISEVPGDRWDIDRYYDPDPDAPGKINTRNGGFLDAVDQFDPDFFGIAPREAISMDPQHRLLLETTWRALEQAGISPASLAGSAAGVFVGCGNSDYGRMVFSDEAEVDAYAALGSSFSVASGRLSYFLGVHGPSLTVDTACSSSLAAVHLACRSLRAEECTFAIVGGVNLMLSPAPAITLSKAHMLSPDGRCKTFDVSADGFSRAEGCGVVLLKRLSAALAAGDRVLAVIRGSAMNQDGRSSGLTAPNGPAQVAVIRDALENARLQPGDIELIEAHGTGTVLGDPIEARALAEVFGPGRTSDLPLRIGSLKSNIGHAEAAAGVGGLIKAVLALHRGRIPPSIHMQQLNPYIEWDGLSMEVPVAAVDWTQGPGMRNAGVSSFGFSGTNVHVVVSDFVEERPRGRDADPESSTSPSSWLLPLSARTSAALNELAAACHDELGSDPRLEIRDACWTAGTGRAHFEHRLAIVSASVGETREGLQCYLDGAAHPRLKQGISGGAETPGVVFMFTGQGAQYPGMAQELFATQPVFRETLERCAKILDPLIETPLLEVLYGPLAASDGAAAARVLDQTQITQPVLFALEYSLAQMWRSWGVEPTVVLGHSVGEYVAACIAGVFSLEDGLRLIAARSRLMGALPAGGAMAAVLADEATVRAARSAEPGGCCEIACYNGAANIVLSGAAAAVEAVTARLREQGVECVPLAVSHAFHSSLMEPAIDEFRSVVDDLSLNEPQLAIVSNLTGDMAPPELMTSADYWCRHAREPVRFADSIRTLREAGHSVFLEIGPHPVLTALARASADGEGVVWAAGLQRNRADWGRLLDAAATLYVRGVDLDWQGLQSGHEGRRIAWPGHPFQKRRFWLERPGTRTGGRRLSPDEGWQRTTAAALRQSQNAPLGVNIDSFEDKWDSLEQLTTAHAAHTLYSLGAFAEAGERHDGKSVAKRIGAQEIYSRMLHRWLQRLAHAGLLREYDGFFVADQPIPQGEVAAAIGDVERALADDPHFLAYIRNCGEKLTDVIAGRESPLETLFPRGSSELAENLYENTGINRYTNAIAGAAVQAAADSVPSGRPIRILEVGAGTGGTSATLLPLLAGRPCEYVFTDLSDLFLERAREKFADFPFVRFSVFNLDADIQAQGFEPGSFDIIVGANVVHASRNLNEALERLNQLLVPGGFLLLVEATRHHAWFDFTTGVIEGWQHFADDLRDDNPLLPPAQWQQALRRHDFPDVTVLPEEGSPACILGQHVILARTGRVAQAGQGHEQAAAPITSAASTPGRAPGGRFAEVSTDDLMARLTAAGGDERREIMRDYVRSIVMEVLRLDEAHTPNRQHRLMDLGLDSLMAVQLRNRLEAGLGVERLLPATIMFDYPTIDAIAGFLLKSLFASEQSVDESLPEADAESRAREIESLSDEEAEARLIARLEKK